MTAENVGENGCLQRDSAEHEEYAGVQRSFSLIWKEKDSAQPLLESACQLLKAPYTERYVRCCERTAVSHRLLLDFWLSDILLKGQDKWILFLLRV